MNDDIMEGDYSFSPSRIYQSPKELDLDKVVTMIKNLPLDDEPEVFGLHANANITCQQKVVKDFMETL
jgi:dynein heavy chain, axonemal